MPSTPFATERPSPASGRRALLLVALLLLLPLGGEGLQLACRLDTAPLALGQWWRLLTAHLVHLGWTHAALNAVGVLLCWALAPAVFDRALPLRLGGLALGISLCLWAFTPQVLPYVGLSGVLYGLFVLGLVPQLRRRDPIAALALLLILGWMLWQWAVGTPATEEALIGGRVVSQAHRFGAVLALLWLALAALARRPGHRPAG